MQNRDEHNELTGFKKQYPNRNYHQLTNNAVFPLDTKLGIPENIYDGLTGENKNSNLNLNSQAIGQPERSSISMPRAPSPDK
jgi:hypothetical protein